MAGPCRVLIALKCHKVPTKCIPLQDFVKWRGPLLHRFLAALVDESPRIRSLADYLLSVTLAAKVTP